MIFLAFIYLLTGLLFLELCILMAGPPPSWRWGAAAFLFWPLGAALILFAIICDWQDRQR